MLEVIPVERHSIDFQQRYKPYLKIIKRRVLSPTVRYWIIAHRGCYWSKYFKISYRDRLINQSKSFNPLFSILSVVSPLIVSYWHSFSSRSFVLRQRYVVSRDIKTIQHSRDCYCFCIIICTMTPMSQASKKLFSHNSVQPLGTS